MSWLWTEKDERRAVAEGWTYRNGYVRYIYGANPRFSSTWHVVWHLRKKGFTSTWHRDIYLTLPWTNADDEMASAAGWMLVKDRYDCAICRRGQTFQSDEEAQQAVADKAAAKKPDPLCIKAIAFLTKQRLLRGQNP